MRTNDGKATERLERSCDVFSDFQDMGGIVNAAIGLSGEVGELNDMIKKWIFHNTPLDKEHVKKEIGDVMWYVAMMCESFGFSLDDVMQTNVDKLVARYPDGFDTYRANHRAKDDV
nr:MAG TPA: NTP-PPase-like protein [Bacteriophage sp.]